MQVLEDYCSTAPDSSVRKTANATQIKPSTVQNILKRAREDGLFQKIMKEKHGDKWEEKDKLRQN
jgi:DNA-binding MarR family transcriptional regulator